MLMQAERGEVEPVERYARRRWLVVVFFALAFSAYALSWIIQLTQSGPTHRSRVIGAGLVWLVWGLVVLAATFGSGGRRWTARERRVLNDELTVANRVTAIRSGYWVLVVGLALACASIAVGVESTSGDLLRLAAPILLTCGIAIPALVFSTLQWRADADSDAQT